MEQIVIYLLLVQKFINLKQKFVATLLCLGHISKNFSVDNVKKTGLNEYVSWWYIRHSQVFNEKAWHKIMLGFIKKCFFTAMTFFSCNPLNCFI